MLAFLVACALPDETGKRAPEPDAPAHTDTGELDTDTGEPDTDTGDPHTGDSGATTEPCTAVWYADLDGDTLGDPQSGVVSCEGPQGYVGNALDCDDTDDGEPAWASPDGDDEAEGTVTDPVATLGRAIERARACAVAYPGTYTEDIDFAGEDMSLVAIEGPDTTAIEGTGEGPVVTVDNGETITLQGFALSGGAGAWAYETRSFECGGGRACEERSTTWSGGGVYVSGARATLRDLDVRRISLPVFGFESGANWEAFTTSYGGAIYVGDGAVVTLEDSTVRESSAVGGGGLYVTDADAQVDGCRVVGNVASWAGGVAVVGSGTLELSSTLLVGNVADAHDGVVGGTALHAGGGTAVVASHVTVADNVGVQAAVYAEYGASLSVAGSIVDQGGDAAALVVERDVVVVDTLVRGAMEGADLVSCGASGVVCDDPRFVAYTADGDTTGEDYHLADDSPAIDAGPADELDPDGTRADMGAYGGPSPLP